MSTTIVAQLFLVPALSCGVGFGQKVEVNRVVEIELESIETYENPFVEIELDAVFTGPDGGERRFPAFWGPNYDWIPNQDHGGVLTKTPQAMLMQTEGEKIFLLPAWPKDWNVTFKLHAPKQTVIEGEVRDGKIVKLDVTPESRRADVVFPDTN